MRIVPFALVLFVVLVRAQGSISGVVMNKAGVPLQSVTLYLYSAANGVLNGFSRTNSSGAYAFTGLSMGNYKLRISATELHAFEYYNDQLTIATADSITVSNGTATAVNTELLSLSDPSFAVLSGIVRDVRSGSLLYGIQVHVYALWPVSGSSWSYIYATKTDALGFWRILGVRADAAYQWKVHFYDPSGTYLSEWWEGVAGDHKHSVLTATPVARFTTLPNPTEIQIALTSASDAAVLSGTVTDSVTGLPLERVSVSLFDNTSLMNAIASTQTDVSGRYEIRYFGGHSYAVSFSLANYRAMWWNSRRNIGRSAVEYITLLPFLPTIANAALIRAACSNQQRDGYELECLSPSSLSVPSPSLQCGFFFCAFLKTHSTLHKLRNRRRLWRRSLC